MRPNYLGDVSNLISRLYFKSNLGKVTLTEDCLQFDPVEVAENHCSPIELLVYTYTMSNKNKIALANPYELSYTFRFALRFISGELLAKLIEE